MKYLLTIGIILFSFSAKAQFANSQYLKKGQELIFQEAICIPPDQFKAFQQISRLQDKTLIEQFNTLVKFRESDTKQKAEIKRLKASITQKNKQLRDLKAQLAAAKAIPK